MLFRSPQLPVVLLAEALEVVGDQYCIAGFSGTGRLGVDYFIVKDFNDRLSPHDICEVCEWLCNEGILVKDLSEIHLTKKSHTIVYEPAYIPANVQVDLII